MPQVTVDQAMAWADKLRAEGQAGEAVRVCEQVLGAFPQNLYVLNRYGICLGDAKRLEDACKAFERAIEIDPNFCDAWANLSLASEKAGELDRAVAACRRAIELKPGSAEYWHRLGTCLGKKTDYKPAIEALRKSVELDANEAGAYHDLVMALCGDRQLEEADALLFERIRKMGRAKAETSRVLADVLKYDGRFEDATDVWRRTLELDPLCHEARGQLAMCLITLGDYEKGWELYESRWDCDSFTDNALRDPKRQWGREPLGKPDVMGKTIMLYSEQGIGDTIQFVRYAAKFAERGARVIVQCPWPVKSLLEKCTGVRLAYSLTDETPKYDWHVPMLSLPHAFGTTVGTIPAEIPYVKIDESRRKSWVKRVEAALDKLQFVPTQSPHPNPPPAYQGRGNKVLRVGLAWAGNPKHKNDVNRSIHPSLFAPLADVESVVFFSLQKSNENEKAAIMPERPKLIDFASSLIDFAETAALVDQLDLVICADTAIAHLAGALGKPVWLMCPFVPDFRWGLRGERTPWYPTMRIFRQGKPLDWAGVIASVTAALQKRLIGE
jgi:tetratricopeptide (TPR) repeat protein